MSMPTVDRGRASHATDPGMPSGSHARKKGSGVTMPSANRNQDQAYATSKARGTGLPGMTSVQYHARMMVREDGMHGAGHFHQTYEQDFKDNCARARGLLEEVRYL